MATILEDFEDATLNVTITGTWARASGTAALGTWALKAATIGNNGTSDAVVTVPAQATSLSFYYRVSSEATYDLFNVLVDGVQTLGPYSGEVGWTQATVNVTGKSQVTFRYTKDGSQTGGSDTAWIDQVQFTVPDTGTPKSGTDSGTLVESASVAQVPEVAKTASDTGTLVERRWANPPQASGGTPPSVRSSTAIAVAGSSFTITKPAGVATNDILIMVQAADRGSTADMATPTGGTTWQLLDSIDATSPFGALQVVRLWWKRAGSSEPSSYSATQRNGSDGTCMIVAVKDASTTATPVFARLTTGTDPNINTPGITPASGSDLEVRLVGAYPDSGMSLSFTPPAGYTSITGAQSRTWTAIGGASKALTSNAATSVQTFAAPSGAVLEWRFGFTVAIAAAVTGPPLVDKTASDAGTLVEASQVTVQLAAFPKDAADTGTLAEAATVEADTATSDTGTIAEAVTVEADLAASDTATLVESAHLAIGWQATDTGTLTETAQVQVQVQSADTGTLVEQTVTDETVGPVASDFAALVETATVDATTAAADTGFLVESAQVEVLKFADDTASLVEQVVGIELGSSDSGTLAEAVQLDAAVTAADSGTLTDDALVVAPKFATDSGALIETAEVTNLGRDIVAAGPVSRRWSARSPQHKYSAGEPRRAWRAGSPRT